MFHTAFRPSSVQLMLITARFLFSLNPPCVCAASLRLCLFCLSLLFFSPLHSSHLPLLVTVSPRVMITSPFFFLFFSLCCVHLDLKLITSDNLLVLFPKFKSFSGEGREAGGGGAGADGRRSAGWAHRWYSRVCGVQYINCLSVFWFQSHWESTERIIFTAIVLWGLLIVTPPAELKAN